VKRTENLARDENIVVYFTVISQHQHGTNEYTYRKSEIRNVWAQTGYRWSRRLGYTWAYREMLRMLKLNYAVWKQWKGSLAVSVTVGSDEILQHNPNFRHFISPSSNVQGCHMVPSGLWKMMTLPLFLCVSPTNPCQSKISASSK
jgi:hypothetical protein